MASPQASSSSQASPPAPLPALSHARHGTLHIRHLRLLPGAYAEAGGDSQRVTLAYFALAALDLLGLRGKIDASEGAEWREWLWERQSESGGFVGSSALNFAASGTPSLEGSSSTVPGMEREGDLAQTYTALLALAVLRDEQGLQNKLQRKKLCELLSRCQLEDGSFRSTPVEPGADARFVFCAFAICSLLGPEAWASINVDAAIGFLQRCRTYEGAFGQCPDQESHAGSTYCALAALKLAGRLDAELSSQEQRRVARWLLARQVTGSGFAGRVSKEADVCYSFWVGASLKILGMHAYIDAPSDVAWILSAQSPVGGLGKAPKEHPDLLHSYLGLAALSLHAHEEGLSDVEEEVDERTKVREALQDVGKLDPCINLNCESVAWLRETLDEDGKQ